MLKGNHSKARKKPSTEAAYLNRFLGLPLQVDCRLRFPFEPFAVPSPVSILGGAARRRCIARPTRYSGSPACTSLSEHSAIIWLGRRRARAINDPVRNLRRLVASVRKYYALSFAFAV